MRNLSPNFTLEELTFSSIAVVRGLSNQPTIPTIDSLTKLAQGLEKVRAVMGISLHIDSGYRCPELNQLVRGVPTSAHVSGYAADFTCAAFGTPLEIVKKIAEYPQILFDQLIQEGTWIHFSVAPTMRQQILTAHFADGKATYTDGLG